MNAWGWGANVQYIFLFALAKQASEEQGTYSRILDVSVRK
jgi:hypothetical protein